MNRAERYVIDDLLAKTAHGPAKHDLSKLNVDQRERYDSWSAARNAYYLKYKDTPEAMYEAYINGILPPELPDDLKRILEPSKRIVLSTDPQDRYYQMLNG